MFLLHNRAGVGTSCSPLSEPDDNTVVILAGDRYVIQPDGLTIKSVGKRDGGTYTCRARVPHTGELEERDISLEVAVTQSHLYQLESQQPSSPSDGDDDDDGSLVDNSAKSAQSHSCLISGPRAA